MLLDRSQIDDFASNGAVLIKGLFGDWVDTIQVVGVGEIKKSLWNQSRPFC